LISHDHTDTVWYLKFCYVTIRSAGIATLSREPAGADKEPQSTGKIRTPATPSIQTNVGHKVPDYSRVSAGPETRTMPSWKGSTDYRTAKPARCRFRIGIALGSTSLCSLSRTGLFRRA
jgi:hypothetical protein